MMKQKNKWHYAWIILKGIFLIQTIGFVFGVLNKTDSNILRGKMVRVMLSLFYVTAIWGESNPPEYLKKVKGGVII